LPFLFPCLYSILGWRSLSEPNNQGLGFRATIGLRGYDWGICF